MEQVRHHPKIGDYALENTVFPALQRAIDALPLHYGETGGGSNADSIEPDLEAKAWQGIEFA